MDEAVATGVGVEPTLKISVGKADCPSSHSFRNKVGRVVWAVFWFLFFRPTPRLLFGWRRFLLRLFGARVGRAARVSPSVRVWAPWNLEIGNESSIAYGVDCYCVDRITIGDHATVSQHARLISASHDISDPNMRLISGPISIGDQAWVCAGAFVLMNQSIGEGAVVGAGSVVTKDVTPWTVVAGNPARQVGVRELREQR